MKRYFWVKISVVKLEVTMVSPSFHVAQKRRVLEFVVAPQQKFTSLFGRMQKKDILIYKARFDIGSILQDNPTLK